jgi:hypothetical protein
MENTIDLLSSILRRRRIHKRFKSVKMSLSEFQRQNLIVKFCLENPNKSKSETAEHFKVLGCMISTVYN